MACRTLPHDFEVFATCKGPLEAHPRLLEFLPKSAIHDRCDAGQTDRLQQVLDACRPDVVLNAVGIIKQKKEAKDASPSIRINSLFPHDLAEIASQHRAKAIYMSTDCVFSGRRGMYTEDDNPDPVDLYGRSKLLGEVHEAPHLTLRTSIIGRELSNSTGLIEWFLSQRGKEIQGYAKAIYSGFTTYAFLRVLTQLLKKRFDLTGVHHLASKPINKYELLGKLNRAMDLGVTIRRNDTFQCDRSLDGSRLVAETGIEIPSWDEMIAQLVEDSKSYESWRR
jgi:dTDP-4-dehydrorhamnose reductase